MSGSGATGKVYRAPLRNAHGDPVDQNGNVVRPTSNGLLVGEIKNILMGGVSASPSLQRQDSSNTSGQIGIPNKKNQIKVQFNDRLIIDGVTYRVVSQPLWTYRNSLSGTKPKYTWLQVEGTVD